jgi:hypothetical protein
MKPYITIEMKEVKKKRKAVAGLLYADSLEEAYEELGQVMPNEADERLCIEPNLINQLIIDLNKMIRRV